MSLPLKYISLKFLTSYLLIFLIAVGAIFAYGRNKNTSPIISPEDVSPSPTITTTPTPTASPSATPTVAPLTFDQMNSLYGPCVSLPTLMYHHVQEYSVAQKGGYSGLDVTPEIFQKQLAYLKDHGYTSIDLSQLIAFFDSHTNLPKKSVLLTFDDGYDDFATYAAPLLTQYGIKASMFLPTGLVENPGYLKWDTISSLSNQGFYFGNHTWSHLSMSGGKNLDKDKDEIKTAQTQLANRGLDKARVFVYPYGTVSAGVVNFLHDSGYTLAFTTQPGRILCQKQRLILPRIRIGNANLSTYGL